MNMQQKSIESVRKHFVQKGEGDVVEELAEKFGGFMEEVTKHLDAAGNRIKALEGQQLDLEQKLAGGGLAGAKERQPASWGERFTSECGDELSQLSEKSTGRVELTMKNTIGSGLTEAGALDSPARDEPSLLPKRRLTIRSLMNVISISSGMVEYASQTTAPTAGAAVAEKASKPESDFDFELKQVSVKTIAHWVKATRQILDDAPQLRDVIDTELKQGLALAEEAQILAGDGTGANLSGLITNSTAFSDPLSLSSPTMIDQLGAAILQNALAEFPATGIVVHPADWWRMRLLKDTDGKYLLGDPLKDVMPSLFGLPVVPTQAMTIDKFLVADFRSCGTLYDRWSPRVEAGYVNDDFTKNLVTLLAEERIAMAVKQSNAITYGDFGNLA